MVARKQVLDTYMSVMTRSRVEELQITVLNELIKMPWGDKFDANQFIDNHFGKKFSRIFLKN